MKFRSLCVFCGASTGNKPVYRDAAHAFGSLLGEHGIELVWGGGHVGLMGVVANACVAAGGSVWGVIPAFMVDKELAFPVEDAERTQIVVVESMHARKAMMADRAEAFVALPGGYGTLDELFEILTWGQLGLHDKPVGLLNTEGFFDPLLTLARHMFDEGFVRQPHLDLLKTEREPAALLATLER